MTQPHIGRTVEESNSISLAVTAQDEHPPGCLCGGTGSLINNCGDVLPCDFVAEYHTLLVRENDADQWEIAFEDWDPERVMDELFDSYDEVVESFILRTSGAQLEIDEAVERLRRMKSRGSF